MRTPRKTSAPTVIQFEMSRRHAACQGVAEDSLGAGVGVLTKASR
jgi:hypothetical protein